MFLPPIICPPNHSLPSIPQSDSRPSMRKNHYLLSKKLKNQLSPTNVENETKQANLTDISLEKNSNLFKSMTSQNPISNDFKQLNIGPRFDKNGSVIPYSIVGKVDSFMSYYLKEEQKKSSIAKIDSKNFLEVKKKDKNMKSSTALDLDEIAEKKKKSLLKPTGFLGKKPQKQKLTKDELLADLNQSIERQKKSKLENEKTINQLETSDKLYMTKESRILKLFEKYENQWKNQLNHSFYKINRKPDNSVLKHADLYRARQEAADAFLLTQSDYEKYGDRVWYMTLRLYNVDPNEVKKILYINDLPDGFKKAIVEKRSNIIEKIRKPTECFDSKKLYKTFTSNEYLNEKIQKNQKILNGILGPSVSENFENFRVNIYNFLDNFFL